VKSDRREDLEQKEIDRWRGRLSTRREGKHNTDNIRCNVLSVGLTRLGMLGNSIHYDDQSVLRMMEGIWIGEGIEAGYMSQIPAIALDMDGVTTLDIYTTMPEEIKVTSRSSRGDPTEMERWAIQLGEQVYRTMKPEAKEGRGRFRIWYRRADYQKMHCPEHGVPTEEVKARHPDTERLRKICPECREFLTSSGDTIHYRVYEVVWSREELASMHGILVWREGTLSKQIADMQYQPGSPPPILWGYDDECPNCPVKVWWDCPTRQGERNLEQQLEASLLAKGMTIEEALQRMEVSG
jgi:hypothetical protein